MSNNKKNFKAIAFSATEDDFRRFYNGKYIKFKGDICDYNNYLEAMVSQEDVECKIKKILLDIKSSNLEFEENIDRLNKDLCRAIYIKNKECLFLITDNWPMWEKTAELMSLLPIQLIDMNILNKIKESKLQNLIELNIISHFDGETSSMIIKGENIEKMDRVDEFIENIKIVETYKRSLKTYDIEVLFPNKVIISNIHGEFNLRKSLSNLIMR